MTVNDEFFDLDDFGSAASGTVDRYEQGFPEPADPHLEASILGGMLDRTPDSVRATVFATLNADDFYLNEHQAVWEALQELWIQGQPIEPNSVRIIAGGKYPQISSKLPILIADLVSTGAVPGSLDWLSKQLRDITVRRNAGRAAVRLKEATKTSSDPVALLSGAIGELQNLVQPVGVAASLMDVVDSVLVEIDDVACGRVVPGLPTGFHDIDKMLAGLRPGQIVIVGARPGVGKTTLALSIARNVAVHQKKLVLFSSLEMSKEELGYRLLSAESNVPLAALRSGELTDEQWGKLGSARIALAEASLVVDDSAAQSVALIHSHAKSLAGQGLALVVVDYLQLVSSGRKESNRYAEVSEISRNLKVMAKDLGVPVIVLSQLSRNPDQRTDKRPQMSDLRDSGQVEADADIIALLHRPDAQMGDLAALGEIELHVVKNRHGPTFSTVLADRSHVAQFASLARDDI